MKAQRGVNPVRCLIAWVAAHALLIVINFHCAGEARAAEHERAAGWLGWRGPEQNGVSVETGLPDRVSPEGENLLWTHDLRGRGTPVIAGDRVYVFGYQGDGPELQEYLVCLDLDSGELIWERRFNDFISDIIYNRYSIGSPTIDPNTGRLYLMTTPGLFMCLSPEGETIWEHSMMERFGRLTFPNGRTGAPVIVDDLVIHHGITSYWGKQGPARDRFFAFDKGTGNLVWASTPGVGPKDSSFSTPVLGVQGNKKVLYAGTGCGNVVCINALNGRPLWRYQLSTGGINCSVVVGDDRVIALHGKENLDDSTAGRMVALKLGAEPGAGEAGPVVLDKSAELWRNELGIFTSSPVLAGNRVYQVIHTGELCCVDADTGEILWREKLDHSQLHASPLFADGKLYVPMQSGLFYIIRPGEEGAEVLCKVQLEGNGLGSPAVWNGRLFVHTTEKLYCFGVEDTLSGRRPPAASAQLDLAPQIGPASGYRAIPSDVLLRPGDGKAVRLSAVDRDGHVVRGVPHVHWEKFIPPTAKVKAKLDAGFTRRGALVAGPNAKISAGMFRASDHGGRSGFVRGRILPNLPYVEDFEGFELAADHKTEKGVKFAYPPLPWIGGRFKWEIRELEGDKALTKTLDRVLFQRSMTFIGHPDESNYTMEADVRTDGNRRIMSDVGLVNQRYIISLKGQWQLIEVSSNHERIKVSVPFTWKAKKWYRLKTRVDVAEDGSGVVRAKAWPRDESEPESWTIEVPHKTAHAKGAPGLFGFSPQSKKRVFIDNISVHSND